MTVTMIVPNRRKFFVGASTDTKPTEEIPAGSEFYEHNTGKTFIWIGSSWVEKV